MYMCIPKTQDLKKYIPAKSVPEPGLSPRVREYTYVGMLRILHPKCVQHVDDSVAESFVAVILRCWAFYGRGFQSGAKGLVQQATSHTPESVVMCFFSWLYFFWLQGLYIPPQDSMFQSPYRQHLSFRGCHDWIFWNPKLKTTCTAHALVTRFFLPKTVASFLYPTLEVLLTICSRCLLTVRSRFLRETFEILLSTKKSAPVFVPGRVYLAHKADCFQSAKELGFERSIGTSTSMQEPSKRQSQPWTKLSFSHKQQDETRYIMTHPTAILYKARFLAETPKM